MKIIFTHIIWYVIVPFTKDFRTNMEPIESSVLEIESELVDLKYMYEIWLELYQFWPEGNTAQRGLQGNFPDVECLRSFLAWLL